MPIQYPGISLSKLTPQDMGVPDLASAMMKGFQVGAAPKQLAADLLAKKLQAQLTGENIKLMPYRQQLLGAQAQQAKYDAMRAEQLGNMYKKALEMMNQQQGGGVIGSPQGSNNIPYQIENESKMFEGAPSYIDSINQMSPATSQQNQNLIPGTNIPMPEKQSQQPYNYAADLMAGMLKLPLQQQMVNGRLETINPLIGRQSLKLGPSAKEQAFTASDAKLAAEMTEALPQGYQLLDNYNKISQGMNSPEWRALYDNAASKYGSNFGRKLSLKAFSELGTPEQQKMIGDMISRTEDLVAKSASLFKGPFRVSEQGLIERMKPKVSDPVDVALGKIQALTDIIQLQNKINSQVPQVLRYSNMSPQEAFNAVMDKNNGNRFVEALNIQYGNKKSSQRSLESMSDEELRKIAGIK